MDYLSDNLPGRLEVVVARVQPPSYVDPSPERIAALRQEAGTLKQASFANALGREYPISTPEETWLSYAYAKSAGAPRDVLARIKLAADVHGTTGDLEAVDLAMAPADGPVDPETLLEKFALVLQDGDRHLSYYPMGDREEVEKSARDLYDDRLKMPIEAFRVASESLVKRASDLHIPEERLPRRVLATGSHRMFDEQAARHAVDQRRTLYGDQAGDLYGEILKSAASDPENIEDYTSLWVELDRKHGQKTAAYHDCEDPYSAFHGGDLTETQMRKLAGQYVLVRDVPVPASEFSELVRAKAGHVLGTAELPVAMRLADSALQDGVLATAGLSRQSEQFQTDILRMLVG